MFELNLAPGAARLDVREHPLEIAHAGREALHLAETPVHGLEPLAHLRERFAQPLLQGRRETFVDRLPHLVELGRIVLLQRPETGVDGRA